ncbi:DUF881 domain-containing protein [Nocardioides jishulii]|uniref:DUF881 domain-containing protein n=1 Tax=Nocardioides jishulii TaxID=2575440 RepID=A0A4U2YRQ7_9ACTN|nr:DUF881 domain-containing protein [Nocardioides jishulii]QCX26123.1 DUF881 domain-containing protein [Nocardioides jishulii]TKI64078.1 DUF881 domain-containing protein [Nocardioides jishulii]
MTHGSHASPPRRAWRWGTPVVFLLSGTLFMVSAQNSDGTDLRPTRYTDLASIVEAESEELERLNAQAAELDAEVKALSASVGDRKAQRTNARVKVMEDPTGFTPRSGTGVTVTLDDAPESLIAGATSSERINEMVVHQQDIQAVVNAMWRGGAEAVTIMGQRIISTTGIKCSGNTVQLQGQPFSPPYVITAVGDQLAIYNEVQTDPAVGLFRQAVADPEISLGWDVEFHDWITAPAYDAPVNFSYAVPLES